MGIDLLAGVKHISVIHDSVRVAISVNEKLDNRGASDYPAARR
jgi:hypothetical protein